MQTITLEIRNPEDAKVILLLARRLDCNVVLPKKEKLSKVSKNNTAEILNLFKEISKAGNLKKSIPDPVKWQQFDWRAAPSLDFVQKLAVIDRPSAGSSTDDERLVGIEFRAQQFGRAVRHQQHVLHMPGVHVRFQRQHHARLEHMLALPAQDRLLLVPPGPYSMADQHVVVRPARLCVFAHRVLP